MAGRQRRTGKARKRYLPIAEQAAQVVSEMIDEQYGEVDWSNQACDIVRVGLHKFITQFGASSPPNRACSFKQGGGYAMPARSASEIEEDIRNGGPPPIKQENPFNERTERRNDGGSMPWV